MSAHLRAIAHHRSPTLRKNQNFIEDVNNQISKLDFSLNENFSFHDLYRICAGIIIFVVDLNKSMPKIGEESNRTHVFKHLYVDSLDGHVNYIGNQILNRSFENALFQNLIKPLLIFYETGEWDDNLTESTKSIINYIEKPVNFFSSETELREMIENSKFNLTNFDSTKDLYQLITEISIALEWSAVLEEDFGFTNEEVMISISPYLKKRVKVGTPLREAKIDHISIGVSSSQNQKLHKLINSKIEEIYADLLFESLKECILSNNYQFELLDFLIEIFYNSANKKQYSNMVIKNNYFFPIPNAKISEAQWHWCLKVKQTMQSIKLSDDFSNYITSLIDSEKSHLTRHRLKILLGDS